jgi:AsmA protein
LTGDNTERTVSDAPVPAPRRRALRIAAWVLGGLVALVGIVSIAAALLIDPNAHKAELQAAFREATGRDLTVRGPLSLKVFPWLAFQADDLAVANRAGFGEEPFASLGQARLTVKLWPLITSRRVEFGPVTVDKLQLRLAVARNGQDNWSDVLDHLQRREPATPAPPAEAPRADQNPLELSIAKLLLKASEVSFDDAQANARYVVSGLTLETGELRQGEPVELHSALALRRNDKPLGKFEVRTKLDVAQSGVITLDKTAGRLTLHRDDGREVPIELEAPRIALHVDSRDIDVQALQGRVGDATLSTTLRVLQQKAGPVVQGTLDMPTTNPRKVLAALGIDAPTTSDPNALQHFKARSRLQYSRAGGLQLDGLEAQLDGARLNGRIGIPSLDQPSIHFALQGDRFDLDRYLRPSRPSNGTPSSDGPGAPDEPPAWSTLRNLDAQGSITLRSLKIAGIVAQDVRLDVRAHGGRLQVDPLRARVFGGSALTRLAMDVRDREPVVRLDQTLDGVDVGAVLKLVDISQLQGHGKAHVTLDMRGHDVASWLQTASGPFDLTVENGTVIGADLWYEIQRAVGMAQGKGTAPSVPNTGKTRFQRMHGEGTMSDRTLHNDRMEFVADFATVRGHGDVDYGRGRVKLDLTAKLLKAPEGRVLGVKLSRVQGVDIPLAVTGALQSPKVQPDVTALLSAVAKGALEPTLEDKVQKKLKKLLGGGT